MAKRADPVKEGRFVRILGVVFDPRLVFRNKLNKSSIFSLEKMKIRKNTRKSEKKWKNFKKCKNVIKV